MRRRRGRSPESRVAESSRSEAGFTLVEVLVVMLIMGIIAGIALPSFLNQRSKGADTSAKAAARAATVAMEAYASDNLGSYDNVSNTILNAYDSAVPANTTVDQNPSCNPYCWKITTHPSLTSTGNTFSITKPANGQFTSDCTTHGTGGCPSNGDWDD